MWPGPRLSQIPCSAATSSTAANPLSSGSKPMPALAACRLAHSFAVDAQLGGEREVRAELDEERPEVFIDAVEVEEVDECRGPHQPGVGPAIGVVAALGPPHVRLLLRPAHVQHPLGA